MGGAAEFPERASSPLKRRASSMDPDGNSEKTEDVDMVTAPAAAPTPSGNMGTDSSEANAVEVNKDVITVPEVEVAVTREEEMTEGPRPPASIEAHIKSIVALWQEREESPVKDGDEAYVVSKQWVYSAVGDVTDIQHGKFTIPEAESLAPVDNSDIILEVLDDPTVGNTALPTKKHFVRLRPGLTNLADFLYFPPTAWELLMQWPGLKSGQIPIIRTAHDTSVDEFRTNVQYELYPPVFTIHRLWSANSTIPIKQILKTKNPPAVKLARSRCTQYKTLLAQAKQQTDIDLKSKVRVWRIPPKLPAAVPTASSGPTPPASPGSNGGSDNTEAAWDKMLVDVETFLKLEKGVDRFKVDLQDPTANLNYNGHADLEKVELGADQAIVLDEQIQGLDYVSNFSPSKASEKLAPVRSSSASLAVTQSTRSGRTSPAPSGPLTRGRARKSGRQLGCVGLNNLGNTCYMNAALQCVRSVEELTKYFLSREWEKEINRENVLAHNGDVAAAYAHLLDEIYKDPPPNSITPRQFKNVIGRYAPAFSGYGQQDSQEFLGFLLDGLQEDLSRIKKKPYIEKPDSTDDMINNPVAIREMADKVWDITKRRDDSVIADLFTGLYKSTLVCPDPDCAKVSITFDPFTNLTLPLPVENKWSHVIKFFPLNDKAIDIRVEVDKTSSMKKLKEFISSRTGVPAERLHGAEEWKGKFYKQYSNGASVHEEISVNDNAWFFELEAVPTNWNTAEARKLENATKGRLRSLVDEAESPNPSILEKMLVPVIHRRPSSPRGHFSTHRWEFACLPHFIILDPEESRNEDAIRRKILQKVATFSKYEGFGHQEESETSGSSEPELVGASGSEFGSSEGKVVAQSVEGEEDIVDVTMKDASDGKTVSHEVSPESQTTKYTFNKSTPAWVDPREYLPPELQNMFEMSFFTEAGPLIVSGMNGVDEGKEYPKLSSRIPDNNHSDDALDDATNGTASNEEESSDELSRPSADASLSQTRMTEESDEEDEPPVVRSVKIPHRPKTNGRLNGGRKKMKPYKNYGKRGNKRREREARKQQEESDFLDVQTPPESEDSLADGGPLIRPREGIIVDWSEDAYNELFGEGKATWEHCETLPDPELEKAQLARQRRRKNGISLEHCLDEFEREEVLSEQDTWYCPRCKRHQRATKKFDLWRTPDILVVHLKRFSSSGFRRDKLEVLVEFPLEGLDLTPRVQNRDDGKEEVYDLIGVDCHWGGLGGGHYTAHAKNFVDDQWYSYNDSSVSKASAERVVDSSAYLLFYRRRSLQPLGGPRFKAIVEAFDNGGSDDDDLAGEGQRLGEGSSQTGSSSAFQERGAGATPLHPVAARGGSLLSRSTNAYETQSDDGLPAISDMRFDNQPVKKSIEEDEGIDMTETDTQTHTNLTGNWSFENIKTLSTPGGNDVSAFASDAASDEAQHDSSGDEQAVSPRPADFDADTDMDVPGMGHNELGTGAQPDGELPAYVEPPPPEYQTEVTRDDITWAQNQKVLNVQPTAEDQRSEEAAEIRIDDEDEKL